MEIMSLAIYGTISINKKRKWHVQYKNCSQAMQCQLISFQDKNCITHNTNKIFENLLNLHKGINSVLI